MFRAEQVMGHRRAWIGLIAVVMLLSGCLYTRITWAPRLTPANGSSWMPSLSDDGNVVAYVSGATNLVSPDTNGREDVFVLNRPTGRVDRVSETAGGVAANGASNLAAVSGNGRFVLFATEATNLGGAVTGASIYRYDRTTDGLTLVATGLPAGFDAAEISDDGGVVAYMAPGEPQQLMVWRPAGGASPLLTDVNSGLFALSGSGATLVVRRDVHGGGAPYQHVVVYDTSTGAELNRLNTGNQHTMRHLLVSDDGAVVFYGASCTSLQLGCVGNGAITRWDVATGARRTIVQLWSTLESISDDGRYAAFVRGVSTATPRLVIQDTVTSEELTIDEGTPPGGVNLPRAWVDGTGSQVAFPSDEPLDGLADGGFDDIYVWNRADVPPQGGASAASRRSP
jgi:hypothetical protein